MALIPIQIIGTQRSGSNLLRLILNQTSEISAHHPPHILTVFFPIIHQYGNLEEVDNFKRLIHDVCRLIETNPVPWPIELNRNQVYDRCSGQHTLVKVFTEVYELMAEKEGAHFWCCKSMANVNYFEQLESDGLKPYYIHLMRDGRDVAASFKKTLVGEKHVYHLARVWRNNYEKAKRIENVVGSERYLMLKYENLIANPANTLNDLSEFLNVRIDEKALEFFKSAESRATASAGTMWQNLTKPIIKENTRKFLTALTKEELDIFERVAGEALIENGYELTGKPNPLPFNEAEITTFDIENAALKQEAQQSRALEVDRVCRKQRKALLSELNAASGD